MNTDVAPAIEWFDIPGRPWPSMVSVGGRFEIFERDGQIKMLDAVWSVMLDAETVNVAIGLAERHLVTHPVAFVAVKQYADSDHSKPIGAGPTLEAARLSIDADIVRYGGISWPTKAVVRHVPDREPWLCGRWTVGLQNSESVFDTMGATFRIVQVPVRVIPTEVAS